MGAVPESPSAPDHVFNIYVDEASRRLFALISTDHLDLLSDSDALRAISDSYFSHTLQTQRYGQTATRT